MSFGTMPYEWIAAGRLSEFSPRQGVTGRQIAALKCYLALAAYRDYYDGYSVLSTYDLSEIGGCSRPLVLEGIAILQAMGLIELEYKAANNTNRYRLPLDSTRNFRKVPQDTIVTHLQYLKNRHESYLDALKLYLAMLYVRNEATSKASISHRKLVEYTGVRPESVAAANGVLAACHFIRIRYSDEWSKTGHPTNEYELLGDFRGKRAFRARPIEQNKRRRMGGQLTARG